MDGKPLDSLDWSTLIDGVTRNVHDTTERARTDRNHDGGTSVGGLSATYKALGTCNISWISTTNSDCSRWILTIHSDRSDDIFTQMLLALRQHIVMKRTMPDAGKLTATSRISF